MVYVGGSATACGNGNRHQLYFMISVGRIHSRLKRYEVGANERFKHNCWAAEPTGHVP